MRIISSDHNKSEGVNEYLLSWRSRFNELIPKIKDEESAETFNEIFQQLYNDVVIKIKTQSEDEYFEAVRESSAFYLTYFLETKNEISDFLSL